MVYTTRSTCRLCDSADLHLVIDLGLQTLSGTFPLPTEPDPPKVPIEVVRCGDCGLVQQRNEVRTDLSFGSGYFYRSGVSNTMRDHLAAAACEMAEMLGKRPACRILDIASNDGHYLNAYPEVAHRVGIDPSDVPNEHPGQTVIKGYFPDDMLLCTKFDGVATFACFYSVPDPVKFARAVSQVLKPDGLWCVEVADMSEILRSADICYWCSEHQVAFQLRDLIRVGEEAGLKVVRASNNSCNGGSIRAYLTPEKNTSFDNPEWQIRLEGEVCGDSPLATLPELCIRYSLAAKKAANALGAYLEDLLAEGKTAHWLAASTKANVLLQYAGITADLVPFASDRDPRKVGRVMPGSRIPIVSEEQSRALRPHAYVSTLGGGFRAELLARERAAGAAKELVFPLPKLDRHPLA